MGWQKVILNMILTIESFFLGCLQIKQNRITFISLESNELTFDSKLIFDKLNQQKYDIRLCLIEYHKDLLGQFLYFLNCMKQLYYVYTSKLVIISNNNYVVSNFKRDGVQVLQLWHACGAIKKFGNAITREYPISGYDYVISTSDYWKQPYHEAFSVEENHIVSTGMPRNDELFDKDQVEKYKQDLLSKYPLLKDKKVILYAPTFRGNIYKGFSSIDFDALKIIEQLDDNYVLLYKYHPLLKNIELAKHERIINMNHEDTHQLFCVSDYLISDYSSIIFDYMILEKPILLFIPDYQDYIQDIGVFVKLDEIGLEICYNEEEIIKNIQNDINCSHIRNLKDLFFKYQDNHSTSRVVQLIDDMMK